MATAKRLYLYVVSAVGLILMVAGAAILLELLLNKVGVGQQSTGGSNSDLDTLSLAIALGLVGLVVWLAHWSIVERMVNGQSDVPAGSTPGAADAAAAERRSIVRSVFLALVTWVSLVYAATLGAGLASRAIADVLGASQGSMLSVSSLSVLSLLPIDDAWSLSIIIVLCAIWAYHAWIRSRDVRQGPAIKGAAAWVSRFYLYYAALTGLMTVLENISSLINTAATQVAQPDQSRPPLRLQLGDGHVHEWGLLGMGAAGDRRPGGHSDLRCDVADPLELLEPPVLGVERAVVPGTLLESPARLPHERAGLRRGDDGRRFRLRARSAVQLGSRCGQLRAALVRGSRSARCGCAGRTGLVVAPAPGLCRSDLAPGGRLGEAHRRLSGGPGRVDGPGRRHGRCTGNDLRAVVGADDGGLFGNIGITDSVWKSAIASDGALVLVGVAVWIWPWLFAQRRRAAVAVEREAEIGSSSRAYYLYVIAGAAVLVLAGNAVVLVYRCLRLGFGLPERYPRFRGQRCDRGRSGCGPDTGLPRPRSAGG